MIYFSALRLDELNEEPPTTTSTTTTSTSTEMMMEADGRKPFKVCIVNFVPSDPRLKKLISFQVEFVQFWDGNYTGELNELR